MRTNPQSTQKDDQGIGRSALRQGLCRLLSGIRSELRAMKSPKAARGWNEALRTATCLLTCLGLAVGSSCSTVRSAESGVTQSPASSEKATLLKKMLPRGTDAEITEMNGRVHKMHVTRTTNESITGTTPNGSISIPIEDVRMARVPKNPPKSSGQRNRVPYDSTKPKQWDLHDGQLTATEVGGFVLLVAAAGAFAIYSIGSAAGAATSGLAFP
jgi:hypothetical protein